MNSALSVTSFLVTAMVLPDLAFATTPTGEQLDLTGHWAGVLAVIFFVAAYVLVMTEEFTHLRKSKPSSLPRA